jgi:MATE family multidrug resistance protein
MRCAVRRSVRMGCGWRWAPASGDGLCSSAAPPCCLTGQAPGAQLPGAFLHMLQWAMIPLLAANVLRTVCLHAGAPVFATAITALAIGVNAAGNYALVFGHWGMPALGLRARRCQRDHRLRYAAGLCRGDPERPAAAPLSARPLVAPEWHALLEILKLGADLLHVLAEAGLFGGAAF